MKNNNNRSHSRSKTPWDEREDLSPLESFIRDEYKDHYKKRHLTQQELKESELLNKYHPVSCPYCGSKEFKKNGFTKYNLQKYRCKECKQNFVITTGTIFQDHKQPISEWIEYLLNLFGYSSINLNSKTNKNAETTSKYWLSKVFILLEEYQSDIKLKGNVQIDETYYTVIKSEIQTKDGKKLRGLSRNKYCIGIGCDSTQVYCVIEGKGKTSDNKTLKAFKEHIEERSHLIHDNEKSHNSLVAELNLESESYDSKELKKLNDEDNPLNRVNHYCDLLKKFLNSHPGFDRDELQGYLNLFVFMMNDPKNKLEKVNLILEKALNTQKVLHFRDYFAKKP